MDVEKEHSPKETFEELINILIKEKSIKSLESIYAFLNENRKSIYNDKIIPYKLSVKLFKSFNTNVISTELVLNIYKIYIDEMFSIKYYPEDELDKIREIIIIIFELNTKVYIESDLHNFSILLEHYFNKFYPKDKNIKHKVGDVMDVVVSDDINFKKLMGWTQMPIMEIDEEKKIYRFQDTKTKLNTIEVNFDSYLTQEKNTFVTEEEVNWKNNLKVNDVVDFYDVKKNLWVEAYIEEITEDGKYIIQLVNGPKDIYKNAPLEKFTPFIQPLLKYSFKYNKDDKACFSQETNIENHMPCRYCIPWNKNNYTTPTDNMIYLSLEYYDIVNYFMIKLVESNVLMDGSLSLNFISIIFSLIAYFNKLLNMKYFSKYFFENCDKNIKNILYKYSLSKTKPPPVEKGWKNIIRNIIRYTDYILAFNDYIFNLFYYQPEFFITFGYNCFKSSDNLEKRHLGLTEIISICPFLKKNYPLIGKKSVEKMTEFIHKTLLNVENKDDIFTLMYSDFNLHEELLTKGNEVIINISELKIFEDKHIEHLYKLAVATPENSDVNKYVYILLNKLIANFSLNQKKIIFDKIILLKYEQLRKCDLELVKNILKYNTSKESFLSMAKSFLDYYYQYITEYKNMDESYNKDFGQVLSYTKDQENLMDLYPYYFKKIIEELFKQNNLEKYHYFFTLIHHIYISFDSIDKQKLNISAVKSELKQIFYEQYPNIGIIVDKLLELYNLEKTEKNEEYFMDVIDIVNGFINFIGDKKYISLESILKLSDFFIFGDKSKKNRKHFLYNIINMKKDEIDINKLYESLFEKINIFLDKLTIDNFDDFFDNEFTTAIISLYEHVNNKEKDDIKYTNELELFEQKKKIFLEKKDPLKNKYFDIIWKMFFKSKFFNKIDNFFHDFSLKNFPANERHEIWEKLVQKIFDNLDTNILLGLSMIKYLIKISEKYGNARAISHISDLYSLEYKKQIELKYTISQKDFNNINTALKNKETTYELTVSSSIWDIKYSLEEILGYDPIIQKICTSNDIEISDDSLPLYKSFPELINSKENKINVILFRNKMITSNTPAYPLLSDDKNDLGDKFIEIIYNIFTKYAKNDVINKLDFAFFIKDVYFPLNKTKYEMEDIYIEKFNAYSNNKTYLTLDEFLLYFANMAQNDIDFTYQMLENLGYTKSLDYYLDVIDKENILYYEKNNKKEFMPRYFISNNITYLKKLFNILKTDDEAIHNMTKDIINELSTPEIFKNIIFEKNIDNNKLDEILYDDNLESKVYIYDIIITMFNDETNQEKNKINNFIQNNLEKIITEFKKINQGIDTKNLFNKKQYVSYYSSIMKLLLLCCKNIIAQKELNDYIDKLNENKEIHDEKIKIDLSEEKQKFLKRINIPNLIEIILNNIESLDKKESIKEIKIVNSTKLLMYLILIVANYYDEKEKIELYKIILEKQKNILLNCSSNYIASNIFNMIKYIFPLMEGEKNELFFNMENEELIKYLKNNELNSVKGNASYLFDLFIYLYSVFKNINNDEVFDLFEYILKIVLDKNISFNSKILEGNLSVIYKIIFVLKRKNYDKIINYNYEPFISRFIMHYLISFEKDKYNMLDKLDNLDENYFNIAIMYEIMTLIIEINPEKYIKLFFENEEIKNLREKHLTKLEEGKNNYSPTLESRNIYVGLYNPSALCYINSVIQQFFMLPLFQNEILSLPLENGNLNPDNEDFLYQLQKMFYYLKYSIKKYYNPKPFVLSFKDSQGKSPDFNEQCDAQEFLLRFIEKINENLKNTKNKYICENIFGGNTLQQVRCTNPECNNISERRDDINYLSLEIKGKTKLQDCLNGFITEEKIEDYHCEKCDKKITHIKQVLLDQIPNILIIHLQRFVFNYTYFVMEKLNTPLSFEEEINLKKYTVDKDNEKIPLEYYDYELKGALIHSGQHQFGHYYSLVYDKKDKIFYEFNDTVINNVDFDIGRDLAVGSIGKINNAYMLIYEKKIKKNIIINNKKLDDNLQKILDENNNNSETINAPDGKIYYVFDNDKDVNKKNILLNNEIKNIIIKKDKTQAELIKYDDALNSLIEENKTSIDKNPFINEILTENIKLKNDNYFYFNSFTLFIINVSEQIKQEIIKDQTNTKIVSYLPTLKILNDFIINIIAVSKEKNDSNKIIQNLIDIYAHAHIEELLKHLINYIEQIKENIYKNYLTSKDRIKGAQIGKYISKILSISLQYNIEVELINKIIQYFIDKIPVDISKKWLEMECFNKFICYLIEDSDIIKKEFIKKNMISKLIDFILGTSSPIYKGDNRDEFNNLKGYFSPIVKSLSLLYKYYENNIMNEELTLSDDDILLINYKQFYDKIKKDDYDKENTNLLLDNKISLILALSIKENKAIENEDEIFDILLNKKIETKDEIISYMELLINILKSYSTIYLNKNNELFTEKLNILLGIPIPTVDSGNAEIKYISGKYYDKYTVLTNSTKDLKINKDTMKLLSLFFDLLNINDLVFNYVDNLPAPNSFKYSYIDYILKYYLINNEKLEKIEHDENIMNKILNSYDNIIKKYNKNNLDNVSLINKLYFPDFSYELKNKENPNIYQLNIKYASLKEPPKTNLKCFNNPSFFSTINEKEELKENPEEKKEKDEAQEYDNFIGLLVTCNDDLDINIEFKQYFNSKLEIQGKKNSHYIFYCMKNNTDIDYSKIKIETKKKENSENKFDYIINSGGKKTSIKLTPGMYIKAVCEVCGIDNIITLETKELKCSFCECPLNNVTKV